MAIADKKIAADLYPFGNNKYSPPSSVKAKKALQIDDIQKIYSYQPIDKNEDFAKDMWLFSYYANGLNTRDVALLKYENIVDDQLVFYRQKTIHSLNEAKPIYIFISPEIQEIINKWGNKRISDKTYIFNFLTPGLTPRQEKERTLSARKKINKYMGNIARTLDLKIKPTTAHARHSFSTVLKRAGVSTEMISEQLGHSNIKTTEIYLDSFEKKQRQELSKHLLSFRDNNDEKEN
jgi:integrase